MEKIYISHEGPYTDWMKNILKNSHVEFRIGNTKIKGKARIISETEAFEVGKYALYFKYYGKASQDVVDDWFFRINNNRDHSAQLDSIQSAR